jgi:hypothetical protein
MAGGVKLSWSLKKNYISCVIKNTVLKVTLILLYFSLTTLKNRWTLRFTKFSVIWS